MILLDTFPVIWWLDDDATLSSEARDAISQTDRVFVSAVTIWEMAIKKAKGRLMAPDDLEERLLEAGFEPLGMEWEHARVAGGLPQHHRDPFDRMLVAQAIVEHLSVVTRDAMLARYEVPIIRA